MQNPSLISVKTWLQLLQSDMEQEAKIEVVSKILQVFGSIEDALIYLQDNSDT
jgi:hypothetical protein